MGNGIFKHFRYSEGNLKPFNFQKIDPQNYLCHAWVSDERVIVGTDSGRLFLFESGEQKYEFSLTDKKEDRYKLSYSFFTIYFLLFDFFSYSNRGQCCIIYSFKYVMINSGKDVCIPHIYTTFILNGLVVFQRDNLNLYY